MIPFLVNVQVAIVTIATTKIAIPLYSYISIGIGKNP